MYLIFKLISSVVIAFSAKSMLLLHINAIKIALKSANFLPVLYA